VKPRVRIASSVFCGVLAFAGAGSLRAAPNAAVDGVADQALRSEIATALGESASPPTSPLQARKRAIQAAKDAVALLRSEGYYDGLAEAEPIGVAQPRAAVRVTTGSRFHLADPILQWTGSPPIATAEAAAKSAMGLRAGGPGRATDVLAAEGRIIARLHNLGYADAALEPREVIVDHADDTVRPTFHVAAGSRVTMGAVRLATHGKTQSKWVTGLTPWKVGAVYDPALLAKLEKRLEDTNVYESATVNLAPATGAGDAPRPIDVSLVDRKPRTLELGASYSTSEGSGVDGKLTFYNRLGLGDALVLTLRGYDIQQKLDLEEDLPDWLKPDQTLKIGGGFLGDRTAAYDDLGGGLRVSVARKFDRTTSVSLGAAFDYTATTERDAANLLSAPVGKALSLYIATLKAGFVLDRSNSILNPTRGWRLEVDAEPAEVTGDRNLAYLKSQVQVTGYLPVGGMGPVLAARFRVGSIAGGSIPELPADRRFYSGGGGSVRGYGYQGVGPRLSDNTPVGGLSLAEASLEIRQPVTRQWGLVAFADAGRIGSSAIPAFNGVSAGAGLGVRYDLGFGPLRLDLATPLNPRPGDARVQVYISIGQAF